MKKELFADIILPLAVKGRFTYRVPGKLREKVKPGSGVIVQFGNKRLYSGIVHELRTEVTNPSGLKEITDILGTSPVVGRHHLDLWRWIAGYYMCSAGEVMRAALPSGLSLESETMLRVNPDFTAYSDLTGQAAVLYNIIENRNPVLLKSLPAEIGNINTLKVLNELILINAVVASEYIREKYKPKEETFITFSKNYTERELNDILDNLSKAPKQQEILATYIRITAYSTGSDVMPLKKSVLLKESGVLSSALMSLVRKGIFVPVNFEVSRLRTGESQGKPLNELSSMQDEALRSIRNQLKDKDIVLLQGVTSSGKTEIYLQLIEEQLKNGKQVLYLLPEIALTSQITERLARHFGSSAGVYHSRLNDAERVEIWNRTGKESKGVELNLILGVRSSLFLPFRNLGLVIVDEEHDSSYKQHDPSPRYHARDTAIILAGLCGAKTLLGSATPSIESYNNAITGKYGLARLTERYGKVRLPEIIIEDTREAYRKKLMVSHFSPMLLNAVDNALENGEQVILFRNRRGFSPYIECSECGFIPVCGQCAVSLTYHRENNRLVCHYCGYTVNVPSKCGNCNSVSMVTRGFGTEKLEDEIRIVFPGARVARMDHDTTRKRNSVSQLIESFEKHQTDILIGTQMISKGLDFDNLTVVGILNADSMLNFPDFRAHERAFQLMSQVSGRAGRRNKHGKVIIQTSDAGNRILRLVLNHDYEGMFQQQLEERKTFNYPPFCRLIKIAVRHKDRGRLNEFSGILGEELKKVFGRRVLGPESPMVARIQLWYIKNILIKVEREKPLARAKQLITEVIDRTERMKGASSVRISVDVDPY